MSRVDEYLVDAGFLERRDGAERAGLHALGSGDREDLDVAGLKSSDRLGHTGREEVDVSAHEVRKPAFLE